jgi:hypothetical protein
MQHVELQCSIVRVVVICGTVMFPVEISCGVWKCSVP